MTGSPPAHGPVDESLTRFVGCDAYGVESLRAAAPGDRGKLAVTGEPRPRSG